MLQTEQTLFTAEQTQAQAQLAHAQAIVGLYKAMGGGWSEYPQDATQAIPAGTMPVAPPTSAEPAAVTSPTPEPAPSK